MKTVAREQWRAELVSRLKAVRPDSPPQWGKMTAHQMICHLSDSCRMAIGQRRVSTATGVLPAALVKWMALYTPLPWPPGILTRPELDQLCEGTKPANFAADVLELQSLLDIIATQDRTFRWPEHPIFGRMSRGDWLRWAYLHTDHHLRQFSV